jgi:ubiquinone/menaquinone biosynthesis C-methylase UbiE
MKYSIEPKNKNKFQKKFNDFYTWSAPLYCFFIKIFPFWKKWTGKALPHISGKKVLEISLGTGDLLYRYANKFEVFGIDLNKKMLSIAQEKLDKNGL